MAKMTQKQFFEELAAIQAKRGGGFRNNGSEIDGSVIRHKVSGLCPICEVARRLLKIRLDSDDAMTYGLKLGLDSSFINNLMSAADICESDIISGFSETTPKRAADKRSKIRLRRRLLKTLGMKETA